MVVSCVIPEIPCLNVYVFGHWTNQIHILNVSVSSSGKCYLLCLCVGATAAGEGVSSDWTFRDRVQFSNLLLLCESVFVLNWTITYKWRKTISGKSVMENQYIFRLSCDSFCRSCKCRFQSFQQIIQSVHFSLTLMSWRWRSLRSVICGSKRLGLHFTIVLPLTWVKSYRLWKGWQSAYSVQSKTWRMWEQQWQHSKRSDWLLVHFGTWCWLIIQIKSCSDYHSFTFCHFFTLFPGSGGRG